jgi:alkylhydroperoxidase family enzyme
MPLEPSGDSNIDKRNEDILGHPPRIAPLDENNLPPEAHAAAVEMRKVLGLPENGFMPESFRMMLIHPELFRAQCQWGIALASGAIPPRERELAVLRNAWLCGAPYEWSEHVAVGKRHGLTVEEIERCTLGSHSADWSEHDRAIMKGVEELHMDHMISDETWAMLAKTWSDKQMAEFPLLVGLYAATAMQQNALRYRLDSDRPGLAAR